MAVDDRFQAAFTQLLQEREEQRTDRAVLHGGGGGGTSGGVTEDWKESVNAQLKQLHDDVRRLTGFIIAGAIAPFLAIIGLYVYSGMKADAVEVRIVGVESRISAMQVEQAKAIGKLDLLLERKAAAR